MDHLHTLWKIPLIHKGSKAKEPGMDEFLFHHNFVDSQTDLYSSLINYLKSMLSGRVLDWRPRGRGFEPYRCHCVVSLSKNINPSLVLVQPRKNRPYITERLLMERKESNQTNKNLKSMVIRPECAIPIYM